MQIMNDSLVLRKEDYDLVMAYLKGKFGKTLFDRQNAEAMQIELSKARLVSKEEFPSNAIGINTKVKILDDDRNKILELVLVRPEKADITKNRVSILAPIGVALLGSREGERVRWKMPSGNKSFTIMEVRNQE
jgi:regulator of nucleoside diphosphate kinase